MAQPAQALASTSYLCHMSGQITHERCCGATRVTVPCQAHVEARDCCERVASHAQDSVLPKGQANAQIPAAALMAVFVSSVTADAGGERPSEASGVEFHPSGPARFLAHCALLI